MQINPILGTNYIFNNLNFKAGTKNTSTPIYAISLDDGSYMRFKSQTDASRELKISGTLISQCSAGEIPSAKNYTFIRADEIESKLKNGKKEVDFAAIEKKFKTAKKEALEKSQKIANKKALYIVNILDGSFKKFESEVTARNYLKEINKITNQKGTRFVVNASDIETTDNDGVRKFDFKKAQKVLDIIRARKEKQLAKQKECL